MIFNINYALFKLFNDYVKKYLAQIKSSLKKDPNNQHLDYRLQQCVYLSEAIDVQNSLFYLCSPLFV